MPSEDITFCGNDKCPNTKCERNSDNIRDYRIPHSFANFTECNYWSDKGNGKAN